MNHYYQTDFRLEAPVTDIGEANEYLTSDDMTKYLLNDFPKLRGVVVNVSWYLYNDEGGYVEVEATRELTEKERDDISDWIRGQNSDGLGEGFEQQSFACYPEDCEDEEGGYEYVMASFDWRTNYYKLRKV